MSNVPFPPRHSDYRRPPRYDRLKELAAFYLGYEPYALWFEFIDLKLPTPTPSRERNLLDLPVMLTESFSTYDRDRYVATLRAALESFARVSADRPEVSGTVEPVPELRQVAGETPTSTATPKQEPLEIRELPRLSERDRCSFVTAVVGAGGDAAHHHHLVRLTTAIGNALPVHLQNWFRFGELLGRCLWRTVEDCGMDVDYWSEALVAASRTDFRIDARAIRAIRRPEPETAEEDVDPGGEHDEIALPDEAPAADQSEDASIFDGDREDVEWLVGEVVAYLEDEPQVVLKRSRNFLWFLGTPVCLTQTECKVLACFAESVEEVVTRIQILERALDDPQADDRKPDQHIQQIINKITTALRQVGSPLSQSDDGATREWLRNQLFRSFPGVGWYRGPLFQRLVVN